MAILARFGSVLRAVVGRSSGCNAVDTDAIFCAFDDRRLDTASRLLKHYLQMGNNPNRTRQHVHGVTLLHYAAMEGAVDCVQALINAGADVNRIVCRRGYTPLYAAAVGGHPDVVKLLLDKGACGEAMTAGGATALHVAAAHGDVPVARVLIAAGVNINAQNDLGQTPLHFASLAGCEEMVHLLVDERADPTCADAAGDTPADVVSTFELHSFLAQMCEHRLARRWPVSTNQHHRAAALPDRLMVSSNL